MAARRSVIFPRTYVNLSPWIFHLAVSIVLCDVKNTKILVSISSDVLPVVTAPVNVVLGMQDSRLQFGHFRELKTCKKKSATEWKNPASDRDGKQHIINVHR